MYIQTQSQMVMHEAVVNAKGKDILCREWGLNASLIMRIGFPIGGELVAGIEIWNPSGKRMVGMQERYFLTGVLQP